FYLPLSALLHRTHCPHLLLSFCFTAPATTEIYTLSLHDALPICSRKEFSKATEDAAALSSHCNFEKRPLFPFPGKFIFGKAEVRSEEHTSELQSRFDLVCRLLLEKKKIKHRLTWPQKTHHL